MYATFLILVLGIALTSGSAYIPLKENSNQPAQPSLILKIETGAPENKDSATKFDLHGALDKALKAIRKYIDHTDGRRFLKDLNFTPDVVKLRSGEPSLLFNLPSREIVKKINKILSSRDAAKYTDLAAEHAALFYRAFQDTMKKH